MKVSEIFDKKLIQWGLRGDPLLWQELKQRFKHVEMPETPEQLKALIEIEFEISTMYPVTHKNNFRIERFKSHGMSSGWISPKFWNITGIPLLVSRHPKS